LARQAEIRHHSFSMRTDQTSSSDRRQRRSSDTMTALHYQLAFARHEGEFDALILADSAGVLVAGAGAWPTCELLAAYAPLVARGNVPAKEPELGGLEIRSVVVDGSEVLLCARGGGSQKTASMTRAASGCQRILRAD
jgi:hypothetical protein